MSSLPNRHELIHEPNSKVIDLPPSIDMADLKDKALRASYLALLQLINSLTTSPSDAVKNRAAEMILQIAFGRDKESLRSNEESKDVVQEIAALIQKAKEI